MKIRHGDVRSASDLESLPAINWIIDGTANLSVLAGIDGATSSRRLIEHNLYGTLNLLETRFGSHEVSNDPKQRPLDVPWLVLDSRLARKHWDWRPATNLSAILDEIASHAEANPDWLDISAAL